MLTYWPQTLHISLDLNLTFWYHLFIYVFSSSCRNCSLPECRSSTRRDRGGRKVLLAVVSLVFGMEVAYKFATKTVIFLLNPCHVITAIQVPIHNELISNFLRQPSRMNDTGTFPDQSESRWPCFYSRFIYWQQLLPDSLQLSFGFILTFLTGPSSP